MPQQPSLATGLKALEQETSPARGVVAGAQRLCGLTGACRGGGGCTGGLACWTAQPTEVLAFVLYHEAHLDMSFGEVVALSAERAEERARAPDARAAARAGLPPSLTFP